jgi:AraC-like DNA-binding protein
VAVKAVTLASGGQLAATRERALLLVHLEGRPLAVRFGDNIGKEIDVAEGGVILAAAHTALRVRVSAPIRALVVEFGEDLVRHPPVPALGRRRGHHELRSGTAARPEVLSGVAGLLAQDLASNAGGFAFRSALTLAIIEGLAHDDGLVRHREEVASSYTGAGIERALRLIEESLSAPISLEALAREAGISPFHLSRSFRRITGLSLQGYVRERRLKEACRLLAETRKPLAEIAYDCGFSSQSRMTTVFRQILDTTPLAFRNQCWRADDRASRDETKTGRSVGA